MVLLHTGTTTPALHTPQPASTLPPRPPKKHSQFAPFNSHYEFLPEHMAAAGITPGVSHWNEPVVLLHDATTTHIEQHKSPDSKSPDLRSKPTPAYSILPPEKLMPFVVPFRGGPGHLCGGPANVASLTRYCFGILWILFLLGERVYVGGAPCVCMQVDVPAKNHTAMNNTIPTGRIASAPPCLVLRIAPSSRCFPCHPSMRQLCRRNKNLSPNCAVL